MVTRRKFPNDGSTIPSFTAEPEHTVLFRLKQSRRPAGLHYKTFIDVFQKAAKSIHVTPGYRVRILPRLNTSAVDPTNARLRGHPLKLGNVSLKAKKPVKMRAYPPTRCVNTRGIIHGIEEPDPAELLMVTPCLIQRVLPARPLGEKGSARFFRRTCTSNATLLLRGVREKCVSAKSGSLHKRPLYMTLL